MSRNLVRREQGKADSKRGEVGKAQGSYPPRAEAGMASRGSVRVWGLPVQLARCLPGTALIPAARC